MGHRCRFDKLSMVPRLALLVFLLGGMVVASVPPAAATLRMGTGTYVGDGSASLSITNVGFSPDLVLIKGEVQGPAVLRTSTMPADAAKRIGSKTSLASGTIMSLDADGFTVGSDVDVNESGTSYYWTAFTTNGGEMAVGTYVGIGVDTTIALPFTPGYVVVMGDLVEYAVERFKDQPVNASDDYQGNTIPDAIVDFVPAGILLGADPSVNASGVAYHYAAWNSAAGHMAVGTYPGDGNDNVNITDPGFQPKFVTISGTGSVSDAVFRPDSLLGDQTFRYRTGNPADNKIQDFLPNGFQIGSGFDVNKSGETYYWAAFKPGSVDTTDLALSKFVDNATPSVGDTITYTIVVTNNGPEGATGVVVTDSLPAGVVFVSSTTSQGSYDSGTGLWNVGAVANLASATLTITCVIDSLAQMTTRSRGSSAHSPKPR
jgi:uncharacterized repeat protein (TIGR01451 family)